MPSRTATTRWSGDIQSGSGQVTLDSSHAAEFTMSFPSRTADTSEQSDPEELIAAALSACFSMNLAGRLGKEGLAAESTEISAKATLDKTDSGLAITEIALTLTAVVPNVDEARFQELAAEAERTCPVSKALAGTTITLDATLKS